MDVGSKCKHCNRSIPGGTCCYACFRMDDTIENKPTDELSEDLLQNIKDIRKLEEQFRKIETELNKRSYTTKCRHIWKEVMYTIEKCEDCQNYRTFSYDPFDCDHQFEYIEEPVGAYICVKCGGRRLNFE